MSTTEYKVSAADVKKLRDLTAAGMMDCQKALIEAQGDFETAITILRKKGLKVSASRQDNELNHGAAITVLSPDHKIGVALLLGCETDFVAINKDFIALAKQVAQIALNHKIDQIDQLLAANFEGNLSVQEKLTEQMGRVGENIKVLQLALLQADYVHAYVHLSGEEHKVATLVAIQIAGGSSITEAQKEAAHKIALQATSMKPLVAQRTQVAQDILDRELEVIKDKLSKENKPEKMMESITKGMIEKFYKEVVLNEQAFLFDDKQTVANFLNTNGLVCIEMARLSLK